MMQTTHSNPTSDALTILVTGAYGFVGSALVQYLTQGTGSRVRGAVRSRKKDFPSGIEVIEVGGLSAKTDWTRALNGVTTVVHTAAITHDIAHKQTVNALAELREVNVAATVALARQAISQGVRRFIFISTVKVLGEVSKIGRPLRDSDPYAPSDNYSISKMEAEQQLRALVAGTAMELVIIRPPLVYGVGSASNFNRLMNVVARGVPMPFASIQNQRSFVGIDNLVDFIQVCTAHPAAAHRIFMVSDGQSCSTPMLIRSMSRALGVPAWLFPVPEHWMAQVAGVFGKKSTFQRLCGTLEVDISPAKQLLEWTSVQTLESGLRQMANVGRKL